MVGFDKSTDYRYVQAAGMFASSKALLHMLFHILGRYHEHERPDRDKYVAIIRENIIEGANSYNFIHDCNMYSFTDKDNK